MTPTKVTVAPLVLLSVVDHYNRIAKNTKKRVVGVVLGNQSGDTLRVTNSFAVPFEEDEKQPNVWFLDHNFIEGMQSMFHKVNANEKLIGWYHSGPKLRGADLAINNLFQKYCPNPLLLIVDVDPHKVGVPTNAYVVVNEVRSDGTSAEYTFAHVPSEIRAEEAEEIGVEHLLRDVHNTAAGTLATRVTAQLSSLQGLHTRLKDVVVYLDKIANGELTANHAILGRLQDIFNLLPNLSVSEAQVKHAFTTKTNDQLMLVYLSSMVRAIIAFHNMIDNKIENKALQA